jgi:hypothetical protein
VNDVSPRRSGTDRTGPSVGPTGGKLTWSSGFWWLLAVGLIAVALCLPFSRYVSSLGDEGVLLHGAERMLRGDRIYIDFFEFLPPGGFIIMQSWFGIAGISLFSARVLAITTIAGIACFTYLACRQVSNRAALWAFVVLGWVVISQRDWPPQISHHWFTTLFSMITAWAIVASVQRPQSFSWGPLVAGLATGAAVMVTPHLGALAMLAAATPFANLQRYWRELMAFFLGAALAQSICSPTCGLAGRSDWRVRGRHPVSG